MNKKRVVITGLGVVAPNGIGLDAFEAAIRAGKSGIAFLPELEALNFSCCVGGIPPLTEEIKDAYLTGIARQRIKASGLIYGLIAGRDAWKDAKLEEVSDKNAEPDWETGCIFGTGMPGMEVIRDGIYTTDAGHVRKLGTMLIEQTMPSGISARLGGHLGLGNKVSTNASACATGTESLLMAAEHIRQGKASRMLAGSCDAHGPYVWGGFDSMRVLTRKSNDRPEAASRPLSASAFGFVPGSGAGAFVLEDLDIALERGARIYAEVLGGCVNSGGHRGRGSMTAPNAAGVVRCIEQAILDANIKASEIDAISGHLTSTMGDPIEVAAWSQALGLQGSDFPKIHSLKSMIGHCLSAAGSIELVATALQLHKGFLHPSINCEDLHHRVLNQISADCIPQQLLEFPEMKIMAKSSFGFGDINAVAVLKKWD